MSQTTSHILMIRPASFQYNEQTAESNDYQHQPNLTKEQVLTLAQAEFDEAVKLLRNNGIDVMVVEDTPLPLKPDAIFPNNWISMHQSGDIYLYPMLTPNRAAERRLDIIELLKKKYKVNQVVNLAEIYPKDYALEGTGSMVFNHKSKKAYACISPRTDELLFIDYCSKINYKPVAFHSYKRNGAEQYHTNVVMCIGNEFVVVCLDSITDELERNLVVNELKADGLEIIEITQEQLEEHFAGNMLNVRNQANESLLVMSERAYKSLSNKQVERIEAYAQIITLPIYLIEEVGGGSARCMMAEIFLPEN